MVPLPEQVQFEHDPYLRLSPWAESQKPSWTSIVLSPRLLRGELVQKAIGPTRLIPKYEANSQDPHGTD